MTQARTKEMQTITPVDLATLALDASTTNGMVTQMFTSKTMGVSLDLPKMVAMLNQQVKDLQEGDSSQTESILFSQAVTLNAIFLEMARRAALNMNEHIHATEAYMRMALRA